MWLLRNSYRLFFSSKFLNVQRKWYCVHSSGFSSKRNDLGQTMLLCQDGISICELPLIVRKVRDVTLVCKNGGDCDNDIVVKFRGSNYRNCDTQSPSNGPSRKNNNSEKESEEIKEGFGRCLTIKSLLSLLETIPACEVTPDVALCALEKFIQLENNKSFRNLITGDTKDFSHDESNDENFTRAAVFNQLVDVIVEGSDSTHIIGCLQVLGKETFKANVISYRNRLCSEILVRATEGNLTIEQVCLAIKTFSEFLPIETTSGEVVEADKLWVGISNRCGDITAVNVVQVFSVLPLLKKSRKAVLSILEKRMSSIWWELRPSSPPLILEYLIKAGLTSKPIEATVTRWTHSNARTVPDEVLQDILEHLLKLEHTDGQIIGALENHCSRGGWSAVPPMAAMASRFCAYFRIRSPRALSAISDILIIRGRELPPGMVRDLIWSLAFLNWDPPNGIWKVLDEILEERFAQFSPVDILDVLLSCIMLGRPPLNTSRRVYTPSYLDRALITSQSGRVETIKSKLRLVDAALSVEWPQKWNEGRPLLSRLEAVSVWQDGRVRRAARRVAEVLDVDIGQKSEVDTKVIPGRPLPIGELHMVDVVIRSGRKVWPLNRSEQTLALLINLPEHYCSDSTVLVGPQMLRIRHLRLVGYHVATLDYSTLSRLWVHPSPFTEYVNGRMKLALEPLPYAS